MTQTQRTLQLPAAEFQARIDRLVAHLRVENLSGAVLFSNDYILYYTGFAFIPTERPIALAINADGARLLYVPRLEVEHARSKALVEAVEHYDEYPGPRHPMLRFGELLVGHGVSGRIGVDTDGYPWILGYRGPDLSTITGATILRLGDFVEDAMALKSPAELALIRESCVWGNLAHRLLQRYTRPGVSEEEVSMRASHEAALAMLDALGGLYSAQSMWSSGPSAGYRGQIGRNAAIPHALSINATFLPGDVLVTGAGCPMWGYNSELERTMIVGEASPRQRELFDHMVALQDTAFEAMQPGVPCSAVDQAVRGYFERHGLMPLWRHHTGHAIGLRYHEGPFLDTGDQTILQPGMVFTVEPGLYDPEVGGFRHSDTVAITESGIEFLTFYPRDLGSLTIPI